MLQRRPNSPGCLDYGEKRLIASQFKAVQFLFAHKTKKKLYKTNIIQGTHIYQLQSRNQKKPSGVISWVLHRCLELQVLKSLTKQSIDLYHRLVIALTSVKVNAGIIKKKYSVLVKMFIYFVNVIVSETLVWLLFFNSA